MPKRMTAIEQITAAATRDHVTPGGVIAFGDQERDEIVAFGSVDYDGGGAVNETTIYDIASLTKPISTAALAMQMIATGRIDPDDSVAAVLGEIPKNITFAHLLGHASGYPAHVEFFRTISSELDGRKQLLELARSVHPQSEPGLQTVYSDIGFILLGFAIERLSERRLDEQFASQVAEPMGLSDTSFVDSSHGDHHPQLDRVAPTEDCPWRGRLIRGQVHDENAFSAGGICGHAGLFSTAADVASFAKRLVSAWSGQPQCGLDPEVVGQLLSRHAAPDTSWRLGWDTPSQSPGVSHAGDAWPRTESVGHLAFTGCSLWLHRERRRYAVILTNRVHPSREKAGIRELRRDLMDAIAAELGIVA